MTHPLDEGGFLPSVRPQKKLLIGLSGPSGSGKTVSALRLATGLAEGGPIVAIDAEDGRTAEYSQNWSYRRKELEPPYDPARFLEIMRDAAERGAAVLVVDSYSQAHQGEGGVLERHAKAVAALGANGEKQRLSLWGQAKEPHYQLLKWAKRQQQCHIIFTFRAKDRVSPRTEAPVREGAPEDKKARREPAVVKLGFDPICTEQMEFEMWTNLCLRPNSQGRINLKELATKHDDINQGWLQDGAQLTEEVGARFAVWARGQATLFNDVPTTQRSLVMARDLLARARAIQTPEDRAAWEADAEIQKQMAALEKHKPEYHRTIAMEIGDAYLRQAKAA